MEAAKETMHMDALVRIFDLWEDKLIRFFVLTWITRGTIWVPALLTAVILLFEARR
jgi:hypothetical protein